MVTLRNIISNIAPGQSGLRTRAIINELNLFYNQVKNKIQITYAKSELDGTTIYLKIPSQDKPIFYDVAVWVHTTNKIELDTHIKIYSNSPGFAYNFTYVYYKNNSLLFPNYYPNEFLIMEPKVRNPIQSKSFDKHVYAALKKVKGFNMSSLDAKYSKNLEPTIKTFLEKVNELDRLKKKRTT